MDIQDYDGEWIDVTDRHLIVCCDCGLTHEIDHTVLSDGAILEKVTVSKKETAYRRRRKDVRASIKKLKGK